MPKKKDNTLLQRKSDELAADERKHAREKHAKSSNEQTPETRHDEEDSNTENRDSAEPTKKDESEDEAEPDSVSSNGDKIRPRAKAKKTRNKHEHEKKRQKKNGKTTETKERERLQAAERRAERKERWKNRKRLKDAWHEYRDKVKEKHSNPEWLPLSAKIFNRFIPARADMPYTSEQNKQHSVIVRTLITIIVTVLGFCGWRIYDFYSYKTSSELLIPATIYTLAQKETVKAEIKKQGFTNVTQDKQGTHAKGTPEMVQAYKNSYKKNLVDPAVEKLDNVKDNGTVKNLISIYVSKDYKAIAVNTELMSATSTELNKVLTDSSDIEKAINTIISWNAMNGTEKTHVSFWHLTVKSDADQNTASTDDADTKEFYSCEATSCSDIISKLEAKEHEEANKNKNNNSNGNKNVNSNDSKNENGNTDNANTYTSND